MRRLTVQGGRGSCRYHSGDGNLLRGVMASVTGISFTDADLRSAAGERSFERGLAYADAVQGLLVFEHQVTATVRGSADYQVMLTFAGPEGQGRTAGSPSARSAVSAGECM